jgi:hypothetical protein
MNQAAAKPIMNSLRVVRTSLGDSLKKAESTWSVRALQVAAFAATLIPIIGLGATYVIDRQKNAVVADNKKEVLAQHYRHQIAAVVGVRPDKVTKTDLKLAKGNELLAQATKKVDEEKDSANRSAAFALGGAAALSSFIPLPGAGTVAHTVSKLAVDATGAIAGGMVSSLFDKDILQTHDVIVHLNEKQARGEQITAEDIVTLRIAQNEALQQQLKKVNGKAFHKMTPEQQRPIILTMRDMGDAQAIALRVNSTSLMIEDVLMMKPQEQSWTTRVGGPRAAQGSFVEQQRARAAASNTPGFAKNM